MYSRYRIVLSCLNFKHIQIGYKAQACGSVWHDSPCTHCTWQPCMWMFWLLVHAAFEFGPPVLANDIIRGNPLENTYTTRWQQIFLIKVWQSFRAFRQHWRTILIYNSTFCWLWVTSHTISQSHYRNPCTRGTEPKPMRIYVYIYIYRTRKHIESVPKHIESDGSTLKTVSEVHVHVDWFQFVSNRIDSVFGVYITALILI